MADDTLISLADLEAARARRAGLHRACSRLRSLLAPTDGSRTTPETLAVAVDDIARLWDRHVHATEAPEGLLAQILADAPRLSSMVERFRREHPAISGRIHAARETLHPADLRLLLDDIDRHRHGGGELIHCAYNIDIGLGE